MPNDCQSCFHEGGIVACADCVDNSNWIRHGLTPDLSEGVKVQVDVRRPRIELLESLAKLLRSYNPDEPMAPGMKANFLQLRAELDLL